MIPNRPGGVALDVPIWDAREHRPFPHVRTAAVRLLKPDLVLLDAAVAGTVHCMRAGLPYPDPRPFRASSAQLRRSLTAVRAELLPVHAADADTYLRHLSIVDEAIAALISAFRAGRRRRVPRMLGTLTRCRRTRRIVHRPG